MVRIVEDLVVVGSIKEMYIGWLWAFTRLDHFRAPGSDVFGKSGPEKKPVFW